MHRFSLIKLFSSFAQLGAEWVMWVLIGLSMLSISIMVERARYYRSLRDDLDGLGDALATLLRAGDTRGAIARLAASPSPAALVALAGLDDLARGPGPVEKLMGARTARVRALLEKRLTVLGTIGNNAPFVGLFGTVIGIIQSFDALRPPPGLHGAAAAAAATAATGRIMGNIAEALVATAIGLLVAIPAVAAFNTFQRQLKSMLASIDALSQIVVAFAYAPRTALDRDDATASADARAVNGVGDHDVDRGAARVVP